MKRISLSQVKGVFIGFKTEDWFERRLERDPRFLQRIDKARSDIRASKGVRLEELAK